MESLSKEDLKKMLLRHFDNDSKRVKQLAQDCEFLGFPIGENIDKIGNKMELFSSLITHSDLGLIKKLSETIYKLKEN